MKNKIKTKHVLILSFLSFFLSGCSDSNQQGVKNTYKERDTKHPLNEEEILEQIRNCKWNSDIAAYKKANPSKAWRAAVLTGGLKKCKPGDEHILREWGINPDHPSFKW